MEKNKSVPILKIHFSLSGDTSTKIEDKIHPMLRYDITNNHLI